MKSDRTKATDISNKARATVYGRDSIDGAPCCIHCGSPHSLQAAHYINRSQGGLGIPENLVLLCCAGRCCHQKFDSGDPGIKIFIEEYLRAIYPGWDEINLSYRKW